jgi:hypothetical protein
MASKLDTLAKSHYKGKSLAELLASLDTPLGRNQYTRLLGVLVKEPFAEPYDRPPAPYARAVVGLEWKDREEVRTLAAGTWQFEAMRQLANAEKERAVSDDEAIASLMRYKRESTLGKYLIEAFRKRICGDVAISKRMRAALKEARDSGIALPAPSAAGISVAGAKIVGNVVRELLPYSIAGLVGGLATGIALLLIQVGLDGYCGWWLDQTKAPARRASSRPKGPKRTRRPPAKRSK